MQVSLFFLRGNGSAARSDVMIEIHKQHHPRKSDQVGACDVTGPVSSKNNARGSSDEQNQAAYENYGPSRTPRQTLPRQNSQIPEDREIDHGKARREGITVRRSGYADERW